MPSYRFCRPDDIPLLVRAVNECWAVHFPGTPAMTVDSFRREMKELDLWPSSCLVALAGPEPIAVLTGTKREGATLASRIGVRPGEEGRGHGSHLLTSLSQKLAVLGPPLLLAEVPAALPRVERFFARQGWRRGAAFTDWRRPVGGGGGEVEPVPEGLVVQVTVDELAAAGALEVPEEVETAAWVRTRPSLLGRRESLQGLAIAGPDRIESWLLFGPSGSGIGGEAGDDAEVVGWGVAPDHPEARRELLLGALLRHLAAERADRADRVDQVGRGGEIRLARLGEGEAPEGLLRGLGFAPEAQYHRYETEAQPR